MAQLVDGIGHRAGIPVGGVIPELSAPPVYRKDSGSSPMPPSPEKQVLVGIAGILAEFLPRPLGHFAPFTVSRLRVFRETPFRVRFGDWRCHTHLSTGNASRLSKRKEGDTVGGFVGDAGELPELLA